MWAFYPESNQHTLEEMNLKFASDSIWAWEAERHFARLKEQNPDLVRAAARRGSLVVETHGGAAREISIDEDEKDGTKKFSLVEDRQDV